MLDRVQERNAELSQANRLKDEFLATLSHELRTPLNAILGWIRIVRSADLPPNTRTRALESIERNAALQARLIEDLLEVSRIVTGKLHLQTRRTDLAAIVDAAVEIVQPAAAAKNITMTTTIDVRPAMTNGDPGPAAAGGVEPAVECRQVHAAGRTDRGAARTRSNGYLLTVTDNGLGIDPAMLPQMFQPFRQVDASPTREQGGLGLGLAIVRQLVELHGGTVSATKPGRRAPARRSKCVCRRFFRPKSRSAGTTAAAPDRPDGEPAARACCLASMCWSWMTRTMRASC